MQNSLNQRLSSANLKTTKARMAILETLKSSSKPLAVSEIIDSLVELKIAIDQATIYRALNSFLEKGIIKRFELQEGKFRYELFGTDHHHLICQNCGKIEDISDCNLDDWEAEINKKKQFQVKTHSLEFYGLCSDCQKIT